MRWGRVILLLLMVAILVAVAFSWQRGDRSRYYSDPQRIRKVDAWEKTFQPAEAPPAFDLSAIQAITVETNDAELKISSPQTLRTDARLFNYEILNVPPEQRIEFDGGSVSLTYIGIGFGPFEEGKLSEWSQRVPGQFFDPALNPLNEETSAEALDALGVVRWERELDFDGLTPAVALGLKCEDFADSKFLGLKVFDGRTHWVLTSGYSWSAGPHYQVTLRPAVWHDTPIVLVFDVAVGPVEELEFEAKPGAVLPFPGGALHLAAMVAGGSSGWSSSSNGNTNHVTLRFDQEKEGDTTTAVFWAFPSANPLPVEVELLDKAGAVLQSNGGGSSSDVLVKRVKGRKESVETVRLKFFPHVRRLVFRLPRLPGLPEENAEVTNLFESHLPYLRVSRMYQLPDALAGLVQLKVDRTINPTEPPGYFPRFYTNTTPAELLAEYESMLPAGTRLTADSEEIRVQRPWWHEALQGVKKFWENRF